ncbi:MAG: pantetheine-phosphate adenylyltransferase [Flavobacteriaceae bacterium]|nr:pantetheine-phosphate adenylyltransferase [Flavobacteriaceae bacterium]
MQKVIFPGSFDPITNGHVDILKKAIPLFDKIIIAVGVNSNKSYMFTLEERIKFITKTFSDEKKINVLHYNGLTVDFCKKHKIQYILRGLRNPTDFEFERRIAYTNKSVSNIETIFLLTSIENSYISSSIVREFIMNKGNYSSFVPKSVKF